MGKRNEGPALLPATAPMGIVTLAWIGRQVPGNLTTIPMSQEWYQESCWALRSYRIVGFGGDMRDPTAKSQRETSSLLPTYTLDV